VRLLLGQEAAVGQHVLDLLPDGEALLALEVAGLLVERAVRVEHDDGREPVAAPHLEVVRVVRGRDLERAGAELRVDVLVGDDRDLAADERQHGHLADQVRVAAVLRVDGHRDVAEQRLRTRGRDRDELLGAGHRVLHVVERGLAVDVVDLLVGDRGAAVGAPVDHVVPAVDEPLLVQPDERRGDRARARLVHGERLARPVDRHAEAAHLAEDEPAVLLLPLPRAAHELLAAEVVAGDAVLLELRLDHVLGGDSGVVHARDPQRGRPLHPLPADDHVLQRVVEHVTHGQAAGHVGRRQEHGERLLPGARRRGEVAPFHPSVVPAGFDCGGVVRSGEAGGRRRRVGGGGFEGGARVHRHSSENADGGGTSASGRPRAGFVAAG
jgi:hypothetical protein